MIFLTLAASSSPSLAMIKFSNLDTNYKIMVNYNGQADLLLSLQIPPDYYPYQFKQRSLYDYLTNINKYIVSNEHTSENKKKISLKMQQRLNELINQIKEFGPSLWNEDLYEGGLVTKNEQLWSSKKTDYLFLEQFVLDDSVDPLFLVGGLPKHKNLIVTNFRAARDPYTLFSEEVFKYFLSKSSSTSNSQKEVNGSSNSNKKLAEKLYDYYQKYSKLKPDTLYRTAKYMHFWNSFCSTLDSLNSSSDSDQNSLNGKVKNLFNLPTKDEKIFVPYSQEDEDADKAIAELFSSSIFSDEEREKLNEFIKNGQEKSNNFSINYLDSNSQAGLTSEKTSSVCSLGQASSSGLTKVHHPALEHQTIKGSSPVSEGTQKDLMVYLAQIATSIYSISKNGSSEFQKDFQGDPRQDALNKVLENAISISDNYRKRLKNIREFLQSAGIVDKQFNPEKQCFKRNDSKTVAIISYPPAQLGAGNSTIQTISKYPFIYRELGLKEVLPNSLKNNQALTAHASKENLKLSEDVFGIDDNGWWWNLGDFNFDGKQLKEFKSSADSIIFVATEDDWNILSSSDNPKLGFLKQLLKEQGSSEKFKYSSYHLWNEGLRSPIALNLLLDNLVDILVKQFKVDIKGNISSSQNQQLQTSSSASTSTNNCPNSSVSTSTDSTSTDNLQEKYKKAMDWGDYWTCNFIKESNTTNR